MEGPTQQDQQMPQPTLPASHPAGRPKIDTSQIYASATSNPLLQGQHPATLPAIGLKQPTDSESEKIVVYKVPLGVIVVASVFMGSFVTSTFLIIDLMVIGSSRLDPYAFAYLISALMFYLGVKLIGGSPVARLISIAMLAIFAAIEAVSAYSSLGAIKDIAIRVDSLSFLGSALRQDHKGARLYFLTILPVAVMLAAIAYLFKPSVKEFYK